MAVRYLGPLQWVPCSSACAESCSSTIGPITHDTKLAGKRSAGNPPATFDEAGAGNVMMAAGLRATAKALEHPPEPTVGAPVLDPTNTSKCGHAGGVLKVPLLAFRSD